MVLVFIQGESTMNYKSAINIVCVIALCALTPLQLFAQSSRVNTTYLPGVMLDAGTGAAESAESTNAAQVQAAGREGGERGHDDREITVMTRNLYFGADLTPVITAPDIPAFITAVTQAYLAAQATDFGGRMKAIAAEIEANEPMFVGLQEAAIWRTGELGNPSPATNVTADFVQLLLSNLRNKYEVVAARSGFDAEAPTGVGVDVRLTIQDVLLVRTNAKKADLKLSNIQTGSYVAQLSFNSPVGPITFPRQWLSVDAKMRGKRFRLITTHLESVAAPFRVAQAQELLAGPASTDLPTIIVGDFNSQPADSGDAAATVIAGGFTDVWGAIHPGNPGLTCCQAADLRNAISLFDQRIDLVLVRGNVEPEAAKLVGNRPQDKTPSGVWPSDHAGLVAKVELD
jgi:endonuclease/exonuclease/phosphatase family metal-dependent hydrolase